MHVMPTTQEASTSKTRPSEQAQAPIHRPTAEQMSTQNEEVFATITVKMYRLKLPEVSLKNGHLLTPGQIERARRQVSIAAATERAQYGRKITDGQKSDHQKKLDAANAARKKELDARRAAALKDAGHKVDDKGNVVEGKASGKEAKKDK